MEGDNNNIRSFRMSSNESLPKLDSKFPQNEKLCFNKVAWESQGKELENKEIVDSEKPANQTSMQSVNGKSGINFGPGREKFRGRNQSLKENFLTSKARIKSKKTQLIKQKENTEKADKEAKIVSFFSFLGKILHVTKKIRMRIASRNIFNVSEKQLELIGDRSHSILPSNIKKELVQAKPRNSVYLTRIPTMIKMKKFSPKHYLEKLHKPLKWLLKSISMFHPLSRVLVAWKFLLCIFILLEMFSITIKLFFDTDWDREYPFVNQYEMTLKSALIADIFVVWNTGIFRSGAVIFKRKEALKYYLRSGLIQDLMALVALFLPLYSNEEFGGSAPALHSSTKNLLKCLFFFKVNQISTVFTYIEEMMLTEEVYEGLLSLTKLFFHIIMISHLIACFWNFAASWEKKHGGESWYDKVFFIEDKNASIDWSRKYLFAWYWSLTTMITVGYGDISPRSDKEVAVASLAMLFGCGFFAYAISSIGIIVETFSLKKKQLRKDLRVINKYMKKKQVDFDLQVRVRKYLEHLWLEEEIENKEKEINIMHRLSDSLREELLIQSNGRILARFSLFMKFFSVETLEKVAQIVGTISYAPEDVIIYDGEKSNNVIYFITKGEVEIYHLNAKTGKTVVLRVLKEGDCFGQLGFFTEQDRNFFARSRGFTSFYTLRREDFIDVIKNSTEDFENFHLIKDNIHLYGDISKLDMKCESCGNTSHQLSNCPFIKYVPNRDLVIRQHLHSKPNERADAKRKKQRTPNALFVKRYLDQGDPGENESSSDSEYDNSVFSLAQGKLESEKESVKLMLPETKEIEREFESPASRDMGQPSESPSKIFDQKFDESPLLSKRTLNPRADKPKRTVLFSKNDETSLESRLRGRSLGRRTIIKHIPEEEESFRPNSIASQIRPIESRARAPRKNTVLIKQDHREEFSRQTSIKTQIIQVHPNLHANAPVNQNSPEQPGEFFDKNIALIFGGLNVDQLRSFGVYFPYNNCEYIINYMGRRKCNLPKKSLKPTNNEKLNKANVGGLIEFRNQQLYFMKNKTNQSRNKTLNRAHKKTHSLFKRSSVNILKKA